MQWIHSFDSCLTVIYSSFHVGWNTSQLYKLPKLQSYLLKCQHISQKHFPYSSWSCHLTQKATRSQYWWQAEACLHPMGFRCWPSHPAPGGPAPAGTLGFMGSTEIMLPAISRRVDNHSSPRRGARGPCGRYLTQGGTGLASAAPCMGGGGGGSWGRTSTRSSALLSSSDIWL